MSTRFDAFNPEEREVMRIVIQSHINTIGEVCASVERDDVWLGKYFVLFEDLLKEISEGSAMAYNTLGRCCCYAGWPPQGISMHGYLPGHRRANSRVSRTECGWIEGIMQVAAKYEAA